MFSETVDVTFLESHAQGMGSSVLLDFLFLAGYCVTVGQRLHDERPKFASYMRQFQDHFVDRNVVLIYFGVKRVHAHVRLKLLFFVLWTFFLRQCGMLGSFISQVSMWTLAGKFWCRP